MIYSKVFENFDREKGGGGFLYPADPDPDAESSKYRTPIPDLWKNQTQIWNRCITKNRASFSRTDNLDI